MEHVHKVLLLMVTKMTRDRRRHPALGGSGATNLVIQTAFMHGGNLLHLNGSIFFYLMQHVSHEKSTTF